MMQDVMNVQTQVFFGLSRNCIGTALAAIYEVVDYLKTLLRLQVVCFRDRSSSFLGQY